MKITIITVTFNSQETIRDTLNSTLSQNYKDIEHIFVDGGSTDQTLKILRKYSLKNKKIYIKKNYGIYRSINYGIKKATGKYILILNSDDIYNSNKTIHQIVEIIKKNKDTSIFLGSVSYFNSFDYYKVVRKYDSMDFKIRNMKFGLMPPHPASVIKKDVYDKFGLYKENFKIAADFEIFLRFLFIHKLRFKKINKTIVRMRTGGISGKNLKSYFVTTFEILKSFRLNNFKSNIFFTLMRIPIKFKQIVFFNFYKFNKNFELFKFLFDEDYYNRNKFRIITKISQIPFQKNFILSGMNLAFFGYLSKNDVYLRKDQYHWPDGIWVKRHINLKKIPGREIVKKVILPKKIKKILVLGNLSKKSSEYLKNKFKKKIEHIELPFGSFNKIRKKISLGKNTLTFITLPTPKQEMFAYHLAKYNSEYKIICIGASINIASGEEKEVPYYLRNYEFLWRLRTEFFRRSKRLFESLFYYFKARYITKKYEKILFLKID